MVEVTKEWLDLNRSGNGAWTKAQMEALGVNWPPQKGWRKKVVGTMITDEAAHKLESERGKNATARWTLKRAIELIEDLQGRVLVLERKMQK